jgi:hypothetical protein
MKKKITKKAKKTIKQSSPLPSPSIPPPQLSPQLSPSLSTQESPSPSKSSNTNNNNYPPNKIVKTHKSGYEWGLGIEHEFIPVIQCKNFSEFKTLYKSLNNIDLVETADIINLKKEMAKITNTFNFNIPIYYPYDYLEKHFPFSNMENTGDKHFLMLETKNMDYKNITLDTLLTELNKNTNLLLDSYNNIIEKHFGKHILDTPDNPKTQDSQKQLKQSKQSKTPKSILAQRFIEPNEGSIFYLYNAEYNNNEYYRNSEPTVLYKPDSTLRLGIDTSGSYHFWITLPHKETDNFDKLHQIAAYLLQSIEPLLIAIYCSPDPRITSKNKSQLFAGSFRGAVNIFANYGTSLLQDYNSSMLFGRTMNIKNIQQPNQMNSDHYIFQIQNKYNHTKKSKTIYNDKLQPKTTKPDYLFLNDKLKKTNFLSTYSYRNDEDKLKNFNIGLNIRRRPGIRGFEFRIMDHLPEKELKNLAKIIYLFACMSYEIIGKASAPIPNNLNLAATNKGWNTMIASALFYGSKTPIVPEYITFLENQFNIKLKQPSNIIELLELLVNICWDKIQKNKENGLWLILEDDKTKPIIVSKNKEILDRLL